MKSIFTSSPGFLLKLVQNYTRLSVIVAGSLLLNPTLHADLPNEARPIVGVTATTTMGTGYGTYTSNAVNGVGLSSSSLTATHETTSPLNSWVSSQGIVTGSVTFNLNHSHSVSGFSFWNQNGGGPGAEGAAGIKNVAVLYSTDGITFLPVPGSPTEFSRVTTDTSGPEIVNFPPVSASFIRFDIAANHGDVTITAFAEVMFFIKPPHITEQPVNQDVVVGDTGSLSVVVDDGASTFQWYKEGSLLPGATQATLEIPNFQTSDAGRYLVIASNAAGDTTSNLAWLFADGADNRRPIVQINSPYRYERVTNALTYTISGTAKDTGLGVAAVFYSINDGPFLLADGKKNWTAQANLAAGHNRVVVKAVDYSNNESALKGRKFFAVIYSPLKITTSGSGTAVGSESIYGTPAHGAWLEIGQTYTITGVPSPNNLFSNWTDGAISDVAKLTFIMESNLVLKANFVTNLFIKGSGNYNGLFSEEDGVAFNSAGFIKLRVNSKLGCSGKILVDGNVIPFSGKMKVDGTAVLTTKRRNATVDKPELTLNLALDFAGANETITGTISQDGLDGWTSDLTTYRANWSTTNAPSTQGKYTTLLSGSITPAEGPTGFGYNSVLVNARGKVRAGGRSADGQILKQGAILSNRSHWPLFQPTYREIRTNILGKEFVQSRGFVLGWITFPTNAVGNFAPSGVLHWINTGSTEATNYINGFTNHNVVVAGSRWVQNDRDVSPIDMERAFVSLSGGNLPATVSGTFDVPVPAARSGLEPILTEMPYASDLTAGFNRRFGVLFGTFVHPETSLVTKYFGAILQDNNYGAGAFMGPTDGGKVQFVETH